MGLAEVDFFIIPCFCIISMTFLSSPLNAIGTLCNGCLRGLLSPEFMLCSIRLGLPKSSSLEHTSEWCRNFSAKTAFTVKSLSPTALRYSSLGEEECLRIFRLTFVQPFLLCDHILLENWEDLRTLLFECCKSYDLLHPMLYVSFLALHHCKALLDQLLHFAEDGYPY